MKDADATAFASYLYLKFENRERQGTADEEKERFIMALTREYIRKLAKESDVELPKEFIDGIISEHTTARDAYADEQVKTALENNKSEPQQVNVKESQEYKDLEKQFNDYKTAQTAKETRAAKDKAYRALLTAAGVHEKRLDVIMKVTNLDEIELDKDGKIKDADKHTETVKTEYADFIVTTSERGAKVATPPAKGNSQDQDLGSLSMKDYIAARKKK